MSKNSPAIILSCPQMGENIGASARGMLNFELQDLRLVAPRDGWPNQAAIDNGAGAFDVMSETPVFDALPEALSDCHYVYATTARTRDMVKPVMDVHAAMKDARERHAQGQKIGFVFGPERTGLENNDLSHCHALIHVPTAPDFSSLNLGQCVLLIAYAWHSSAIKESKIEIKTGDADPVTHEKMEELFLRLEGELDKARFFRDDNLKPAILRNIRNMLLRAEITDQEARTFHGIISALIGNKTQD